MAIPCTDREEHRPLYWAVLDREWLRLGSWDPGESTPGTSTLTCRMCKVAWRSKAKYATELPDLVKTTEAWELNQRAIAEIVQIYPLLAELTYWTAPDALACEREPFLHDLGRKLESKGYLTQRQIDTAWLVITNRIGRANRAQILAGERADRIRVAGDWLAPEGFQAVVGLVEEAWMEDTPGPGQRRMMVLRSDQGFRVRGTVPVCLVQGLTSVTELRGRRVELHADLTRSRDDWAVAYARRPRQTSRLLDDRRLGYHRKARSID